VGCKWTRAKKKKEKIKLIKLSAPRKCSSRRLQDNIMVKKFDKKNATTYSIVHRAHDDARFFEDDATNVLVPTAQSQKQKSSSKKVFSKNELEARLRDQVRDNEGLAAQYGITFDDSNYDYMQHLKPLGDADGVFILAKDQEQQRRRHQQQQKLDLDTLLKDQLPSSEKRKVTKDLNQSIPDELRGFNPNMDPRLREVLEALDDEAYIEEIKHKGDATGDNENEEDYDDDIFADLLKSGQAEEDEYEYNDEQGDYDDDYDEWDLDNYEDEYNAKYDEHPEEIIGQEGVNEDWQRDFMKFKKESKNKENTWDSDDEFGEGSEEEDEIDNLGALPDMKSKPSKSNTKLRRKKGAMTDTSSFSMSSSALFRSEGLSVLDDRYEQMNKNYNRGDTKELEYKPFDMESERTDFASMVDDFLDNYELESGGRKLTKKDAEKTKLQQAASSVSRGKAGKKLNSSFAEMKIN